MIPQIAYFHWAGEPMTWLREAGVSSFRRLNPAWDVRVVPSNPETIRPGLSYAHQGDWTNWLALYDTGGFKIDTDTIFLKPIPDEWRLADFCACMDGRTNAIPIPLHIGMVGCIPLLPLMGAVVERCRFVAKVEPKFSYESFGAPLLRRMVLRSARVDTFSFTKSALTRHDENQVDILWAHDDIEILDTMFGVHWYGGHVLSDAYERTVPRDSIAAICRLANQQQ